MDLKLPDASYDQVLVYFLLHEQPREWRERTLREVYRVVKPGGKVVIVDYARPFWWHPLRYLFPALSGSVRAVCAGLVARRSHRLAVGAACNHRASAPVFGGLYQLVVSRR